MHFNEAATCSQTGGKRVRDGKDITNVLKVRTYDVFSYQLNRKGEQEVPAISSRLNLRPQCTSKEPSRPKP